MFEGKIAAILPANRVTKDQLGLLMAGSNLEDLNINLDGKPVKTDVRAVF